MDRSRIQGHSSVVCLAYSAYLLPVSPKKAYHIFLIFWLGTPIYGRVAGLWFSGRRSLYHVKFNNDLLSSS